MNRLAEIIAHKRIELEPLIAYTEAWQERAQKLRSFRGFRKSLSADSFGFIAEVKKASLGLSKFDSRASFPAHCLYINPATKQLAAVPDVDRAATSS